MPEALFAQPLQKACWNSELLNARTVRPMTTTRTTTSTKPHPISTAGTAELLRAGWAPSGRHAAPSQYCRPSSEIHRPCAS